MRTGIDIEQENVFIGLQSNPLYKSGHTSWDAGARLNGDGLTPYAEARWQNHGWDARVAADVHDLNARVAYRHIVTGNFNVAAQASASVTHGVDFGTEANYTRGKTTVTIGARTGDEGTRGMIALSRNF